MTSPNPILGRESGSASIELVGMLPFILLAILVAAQLAVVGQALWSAGVAARELEERLAAHLPEAEVASRGRICHLALPGDAGGLELIGAAIAVGRGSTTAIHLPPRLVQAALDGPLHPTGAMLRADLAEDRALTALAVGDLIERGVRPAVLKRPLGRLTALLALAGALGPGLGEPLAQPSCARLLAA